MLYPLFSLFVLPEKLSILRLIIVGKGLREGRFGGALS